MSAEIDVEWMIQKGYYIESHLKSEGIGFEAFDIINKSDKKAGNKIRKKIISRFMRHLRSDFLESYNGVDIINIKHGVYCIAVGSGFEILYKNRESRILYIGSGGVYSRIKSHLSGKLFDFVRDLKTIPLRFYICDLTDFENGKDIQRSLEYALLMKFREDVDDNLPLLNKRSAPNKIPNCNFSRNLYRPIQRDKGPRTTQWLIKPHDEDKWKGALG